MRRFVVVFLAVFVLGTMLAGGVSPASGQGSKLSSKGEAKLDSVPLSGAADFRDANFGTRITECPQAGLTGEPRPLDRREIDEAEEVSEEGDDIRPNDEYSCFPQDETSIDTNPRDERNIVAGANDYRLGFGSSGFYATSDGGRNWYGGIQPFPSLPNGDNLDGGGDPAIAFDSDGVVYYAEINFNRTDDTNGIFVMRSTNGGFTWTRACVPIDTTPTDPTDDAAACGGTGDPRQPGDGVVSFQQDLDGIVNGSVPFDDKEYIAVGPRPEGVEPTCFTPIQRAPRECDEDVVGSDRIYITWTRFTEISAEIQISYSDDQGRSWSPRKSISGSAPFCAFGVGNNCDFNQFSVPTVHPKTGALGVAFENFNTPDENQYLFVRSNDGSNTFEGPFFVTPVYDVNFPRAGAGGGRPDCTTRGQQSGRIVYTNSCFRSNAGGNVVFDDRSGAFADDLYLVMSDNRNGTPASSNSDVFLFKSNDGGSTWIGPTRVNDDRSELTGSRDDPDNAGDFGNDQWWPWVDIGKDGDLNVIFHDRRLDTDSVEHEWPTSRQRPGNYLVWTWGAQCRISKADSTQCLAPGAAVIPQPAAPFDPGDDPVPGQGSSFLGSFANFQVSDVPSNFDYTFRAGIFAGDYNNVAVGDSGSTVYAFFTDARNGRSSGGPAGGTEIPSQPGRNPACEQSDVFFDSYKARGERKGGRARSTDALFLVTPCPADAVDDRQGRD